MYYENTDNIIKINNISLNEKIIEIYEKFKSSKKIDDLFLYILHDSQN